MSLFQTLANEINPNKDSHVGIFDRVSNALSTPKTIEKKERTFGGIFSRFFVPDRGPFVRLKEEPITTTETKVDTKKDPVETAFRASLLGDDVLFGPTKTTTPKATGVGTADVLRVFGQGIARGFGAGGAAIAGVPKQILQTAKGEPAPVGELQPVGEIQQAIFGTDQPISLATEAEEITFGLVPKESPAAPFIGGALSLLDLAGGGGVKGIKGLTSSIKTADNIGDVASLMKGAGFADDVISMSAPTFAKMIDTTSIEKALLKAEKFQNTTQAAAKQITPELEPLAQEARKFKTAEEFNKSLAIKGKEVGLNEKPPHDVLDAFDNLHKILIGPEIPENIRVGTLGEIVDHFDKQGLTSNITEVIPRLRKAGYTKIGDFHITPSGFKTESQLTDIFNQAKQVDVTDAKIIKDDLVENGRRMPFADRAMRSESERGFITTVKESPNTSPEVAKKIASNYNPISNVDTFKTAENLIRTNPDEAFRLARDTKTGATAHSNAVAQLLVRDAQNAGRYNEAIELVEITAERANSQGQALQALSVYNRLTPEGILRFTQNIFNKSNKATGGNLKLTDEFAKDIVQRSRRIAKMPDGRDKAVDTARMIAEIEKQIPASFARKVATFQILAQLLNPKTLIRNLGGNTAFSVLENVKDVPAAAFDSALSLITGQRTKTLPSVVSQLKGAKEGFLQGINDAMLGIDTLGTPTRFDIPKTPVFKGIVGRSAEQTLNLVLRAPDRAAYKAAYDGSLYQQMKIAAKENKGIFQGEPTDVMKEVAHYEGMYRTFQDENLISKAFVSLKNDVLNLGKEFGMGDILLKYPKTPGNLLARGLDYSPAGFVNTVYEAARPLIGKGPFDQRAFVESFTRALTGTTSLVGTGALLHKVGIITGKREKDKDIAGVQRVTGLGQYKINASALKRFALSGLNVESAKIQPGDKLFTYDWFQPLAIGISMGANIDENHQLNAKTGEKIIGPAMAMLEGVASGFNTLGEQPLIENLTRLLKFGEVDQAFLQTIKQIPRSFVPTLLSQVNQYVDNKSRNVYDPSLAKEAFNGARQRVPGAAQGLPPRVGVFGNDLELYKDSSNNLFNVFFNPSFRSIYTPTPESELVLDLYNVTGETKQAPRVVSKTVNVNGEKVKIGPQTLTQMQRFVGTQTRWYFNTLAQNEKFKTLPDEEKVKHMSNVLTDIGTAAKIIVLGHRPTRNPSTRVQQIMAGYMVNPNREELTEIEQFNSILEE